MVGPARDARLAVSNHLTYKFINQKAYCTSLSMNFPNQVASAEPLILTLSAHVNLTATCQRTGER